MTKQNRLKQYGITSDIQIIGMIDRVCDIFGNGKNNNAKVNIEKLIRHESHFGNITDYSGDYGEGLSQIDEGTFEWIMEKLNSVSYSDEYTLFQNHYGFNFTDIGYEDLRIMPEVAIALTRLRYKFVPDLFPSDNIEQFDYYKKHWNGGGAATLEKWNKDTKNCYFKSGD